MTKGLTQYQDHILKSFRDGFPNGTAYQRRECKGLAIKFIRGPEITEVFLTVPEWKRGGQHLKTILHSLIVEKKTGHRKGTILTPTRKLPRGQIGKDYSAITWNKV
jgi:hypothetical protein